jgi:Secretion system C-terminal sorting domain
MMKKITFLAVIIMIGLNASAQMPTNYLQITLYKNLLLGSCNLSQDTDNLVYIHSGAGYKSNTSLWDCVVGNWGKADGIGEMTTINDSTYQICMDLSPTATNYYSNPNTANADSGVMPVGSTIYNIGCVFRDAGPFPLNAQGQPVLNLALKGAANDNCSDIWLIGVNTGNISIVEQFDGSTPVASVSAAFVSSCPTVGVHDISNQLIDDIRVSPNPFKDNVTVQFNMLPRATKVTAQVFDVMGKRVADFTPGITPGYNYFSWDGADINDIPLPAGTYLLKVTNGTEVKTAKLVKL